MRRAFALVVVATMAWAVAQASGNAASATPVAYIGCSNSSLAVDGYHLDGGTRMWPATRAYNDGTVLSWMTPGTRYWRALDSLNATYPAAKQLWFQPCVPLMTRSLLRPDGVHPNEAGTLRLGQTLLGFLRRQARARSTRSGRRCGPSVPSAAP